jgi:hypothetical protein
MDREADEEEWIEIRRFDDPLRASLVSNFLREHGVHVSTRGDPGTAAVLNRFATLVDIRLDVRRRDLDTCLEVLAAMESEGVDHPFRGGQREEVEKDRTPTEPLPRKTAFAAFLGLLFPIGAGHFYARHGAAGTILCAGILGGALGAYLGRPELLHATGLLVAADVVGAHWAVKRHNEQRVPPEAVQIRWAMVVVALAFAAALLRR